jgi:hypothetical protein
MLPANAEWGKRHFRLDASCYPPLQHHSPRKAARRLTTIILPWREPGFIHLLFVETFVHLR